MKKLYYLIALLFPFIIVSCDLNFLDDDPDDGDERIKPEIVKTFATEITMYSVILNATVNTDDGIGRSVAGFYLSDDPSIPEGNRKQYSCKVGEDRSFSAEAVTLTPGTTYYFKAVYNYYGATEGEITQFKTKDFKLEAVDLGLNVKWANANMGANSPLGWGDYYAWAETDPKTSYDWNTYKYVTDGKPYNTTKYNPDPEANNTYVFYCQDGMSDYKDYAYVDDPARTKLGGKWRTPTPEDVEELAATFTDKNYKWEWMKALPMTQGYRITYLKTGASIFLPAGKLADDIGIPASGGAFVTTGCYWTSRANGSDIYNASCMTFSPTDNLRVNYNRRCYGMNVRPVAD